MLERQSRGDSALLQSPQYETNTLGTLLVLEKRQPLFHSAGSADEVYLIESGLALVYRNLPSGQRQILELVQAGDVCGFTDRSRYVSSCYTLTPCIVRRIRQQDVAVSTSVRSAVTQSLRRRLEACHDHIVLLGRSGAEAKVCALLLWLRDLESAASSNRTSFHVPLTRTEIADYLGLTLETVVRTFKDLERRQIIELNDRYDLRIVALEAMRERASQINR
ncbi:MAG: helix-turn-helix domain-containing protein [Alphaproteobacteria bacterium]|nr:helix-turn-helix domain-containing protein [Alphaproteobacteria bacterium]